MSIQQPRSITEFCVCVKNVFMVFFPGEKDRGRRVWGDLRGAGLADADQCGAEGGVGPAAQTGAQDGGRRAQEAPGWAEMDSQDLVTFLPLIFAPSLLLAWWPIDSPQQRIQCH